jgi:hypothetical protein
MPVSVVIPLYNKSRHISRAIESVLNQSYRDFELVVIDDGSTDGGGRIVRNVNDGRIRLIEQANQGVSAARNRGIMEARYPLAAFLDADDEWRSCFLATVISLRKRFPDAGIYATAYRFCQNRHSWRPSFANCVSGPEGGLLEDYFKAGYGAAPVWSSAAMIPKAVLQEVGLFPAGISRGEDLHTWVRIALRYRIAWSPVEGAVYHLSADNRLCATVSNATDVPFAPVIDAFLQSGDTPPVSIESIREYCHIRRLQMVLSRHLMNKTDVSRELLRKTKTTRLFRRKRLFLLLLTRIPPGILKAGLSIKNAIKSRLTRWGEKFDG